MCFLLLCLLSSCFYLQAIDSVPAIPDRFVANSVDALTGELIGSFQEIVELEYDKMGRVKHLKVSSQGDRGHLKTYLFTYNNGSTDVTQDDGVVKRYEFDEDDSLKKVTTHCNGHFINSTNYKIIKNASENTHAVTKYTLDQEGFIQGVDHETISSEGNVIQNSMTRITKRPSLEELYQTPVADLDYDVLYCQKPPQGPPGPEGPVGPQGSQGEVGPVGPQGPAGPQGIQGPEGPEGPEGPQGIQGIQGDVGPQGPQGIQGETGPEGPEGPEGPQGIQGIQGDVGPQGPQGIQGETGPEGPEGPAGPAGPQGIQGIQGDVGPQGPQGIQGETGPEGPAGPAGPQGIQGDVGPQGPQGIQGETGPEGPAGPAGPQGIQGIQGDVGPQGPQGIQGETGPEGPAGPAGPQGIQGIQGDVGPQGPQGIQGETGPEGPEGPQGPAATLFNFSASRASVPSFNSSTQITAWSVADPYYTGTGFDDVTGDFTVPQDGKYSIRVTINYNTAAQITASIGGSVNPSFVVRRTSPVVTDLITGNLPVFDVNVLLVLNLRVILGSGQVIMTGDVNLSEDDVIGVFYNNDGLSLGIELGGTNPPGIIWSIHSI